jgi:hypothetical protein
MLNNITTTDEHCEQMVLFGVNEHKINEGRAVAKDCIGGTLLLLQTNNNKLRGLSPPANYTDRGTAACRPS